MDMRLCMFIFVFLWMVMLFWDAFKFVFLIFLVCVSKFMFL